MFYRFISVTGDFANQKVSQSAVFARDTIKGFLTTMHHILMALGIAAIAAWSVMFFKPEFADHLKALSPFAETVTEEPPVTVPPLTSLMDTPSKTFASPPVTSPVIIATIQNPAQDAKEAAIAREQKWVTAWLSKRYRVASDATDMLVSAAYSTASEIKLDPLLILAVMAIESGLNPFAESPVGAQGLMQVMSKVHHDKFRELGGVKAALNPAANIKVGSQILKEYVRRGGSVEAGLKMYVGAAAFDTDFGYGSRVLAEYQRLKDVSNGKKVPVYATRAAAPKPPAPVTTPKSDTEGISEVTPPVNQVSLPDTNADQIAAL